MTEEFFSGSVFNTWYVHYNDNRDVLLISGLPAEEYKNFEIDVNLIPSFVEGKKDCTQYTLDYFIKISEGLITDDNELETNVKSSIVLYELPKSNKDAEFVLIHRAADKEWHVLINNLSNSKLETFNTVPLYITLKDNPNFLIRTIVLTQHDIKHGRNVVLFKTEEEEILNNISVLTTKQFKDYSIKEAK